jgi:hypothetical protein
MTYPSNIKLLLGLGVLAILIYWDNADSEESDISGPMPIRANARLNKTRGPYKKLNKKRRTPHTIEKSNNLKQLCDIRDRGFRGVDGKDYGDHMEFINNRIAQLEQIKLNKESEKFDKDQKALDKKIKSILNKYPKKDRKMMQENLSDEDILKLEDLEEAPF